MNAIENKPVSQRNSSIELLRIISMAMIVLNHFASHGGFSFDAKVLTVPRLWYYFILMGGQIGVDVFILISGYFLAVSSSKNFNLKKVLKFWGQVAFYSVAFYFVFCAVGKVDFKLSSCVKAFFPITFDSWWFASTYFVLYLIHPFINMLLQKLDKKSYQALIVIELILWSVIPTFTTASYQSNNLIWFITLYCIGGYIRTFGLNPRFTKKHYVCFLILFSALRYLSCVVLMLLGTKIQYAANHSVIFYTRQSVLTLLCALSFFMIFEKWNLRYNKRINLIASASFGVYLIHENVFVSPFLWQELFKNAHYQNSLLVIPYSVMAALLVYAVCTLIDLLRQYAFEKPFMKLVNRYSEKITKPFEFIIDFVKGIVFGKDN